MKRLKRVIGFIFVSLIFFIFCKEGREGRVSGPIVVFSSSITPFPSDIFMDRGHIFLPKFIKTHLEEKTLEFLEKIDGFSTYPIIILPLSEDPIPHRISYPPQETDDIILLKLEDLSLHPIDVGYGFFPYTRKNKAFPYDYDINNFLFTHNITYAESYDKNLKILIIRPILPLEEGKKYAVLVNIKNREGKKFSSPFGDHLPSQSGEYYFVKRKFDFSFMWTFTTRTFSEKIFELRERAVEEAKKIFEKKGISLFTLDGVEDGDGNPITLKAEPFGKMLSDVISSFIDFNISTTSPFTSFIRDIIGDVEGDIKYTLLSIRKILRMESVDYFIFGKIYLPYFLNGGIIVDEPQGITEVPFMVSVPKILNCQNKTQFSDIAIVGHGYSGSKIHLFVFADALARECIVGIALDAPYHGNEIEPILLNPEGFGISKEQLLAISKVLMSLFKKYGLKIDLDTSSYENLLLSLQKNGLLRAISSGRAEDFDGDGLKDSGANYFVGFIPQTYSSILQHVLELSSLLSILKNGIKFGNITVGGGNIFYVGVSMGGIVGGVFSGVEKKFGILKRSVLNVPGGGLIDIAMRTSLSPKTSRGINPINDVVFGLYIAGGPEKIKNNIFFPITFGSQKRDKDNGLYLEVLTGDRVEIINITKLFGITRIVDKTQHFWGVIPADKGDEILIRTKREKISFRSPMDGFGVFKNNERFLLNLSLSQTILDPVDPINWAKNLTDVLLQIASCDDIVPFSTGIHLALASKNIKFETVEKLASDGYLEGLTKFYNVEENEELGNLSVSYCSSGGHGMIALAFYQEVFDENCNVLKWDKNKNGTIDFSVGYFYELQLGEFLKKGVVKRVRDMKGEELKRFCEELMMK